MAECGTLDRMFAWGLEREGGICCVRFVLIALGSRLTYGGGTERDERCMDAVYEARDAHAYVSNDETRG